MKCLPKMIKVSKLSSCCYNCLKRELSRGAMSRAMDMLDLRGQLKTLSYVVGILDRLLFGRDLAKGLDSLLLCRGGVEDMEVVVLCL